jgi:competence protein ComEA
MEPAVGNPGLPVLIEGFGKAKMRTRCVIRFSIVVIALLVALAGCSAKQNNPQEVKEKTAQATAAIKNDAQAVAEGVREGWSRDKPLDLNTATQEQLHNLPGITDTQARRIVAARPYHDRTELVTRGILPKREYDAIADRITVRK